MPNATDHFYLYSGDDGAQLDRLLSAALKAREDRSPRTALEPHPYETLKAEVDALKAEAEARGTEIVLTAVNRNEWRALKEKYPPRSAKDVDEDIAEADRTAGGINIEDAEDDLVFATLTVPEFSSRAAFDEWAGTLSQGEWNTLARRSWNLAMGASVGPLGELLPSLPTSSDD